ncbi:hypothetical protein Tco_1344332 [Tanacetum coccineum]
MNEDYYHEQNSCYDYNSFGFDQFQPPQYTVNHPIFDSQNELLNSSNKLMEQMTTLRDLVGQVIQKKEEEKRIAEEQAAKDRYWKIPICYDDDEDNTIAITPFLPIEEPITSNMGDEHLATNPQRNHTNSGSPTTHSDYSLPDYEAFYSNDDHIEERCSGSTTTHANFSHIRFDFQDCEDSRVRSIHMSFTSSASFGNQYPKSKRLNVISFGTLHKRP